MTVADPARGTFGRPMSAAGVAVSPELFHR
jgi:hypothetical protein